MSKRIFRTCLILVGCILGCEEHNPDLDTNASFYVSPETAIQVPENGGSNQYIVKLNSEPIAPVTIAIHSPRPETVSASSDPVVIRPDMWQMAWTLAVSCHDNTLQGDQTVNLAFVSSSVDPAYNNVIITRQVTCIDDDTNLPDDGNNNGNGDNGNGDNGNGDNGNGDNGNGDNGNGDNGNGDNGNGDNGNTDYPSIEQPDFPTIERVSLIKVTPTSGLYTSEDGDKAQFAVEVTYPIKSPVAVLIKSLDTTEGTVSPNQLLFTPSNWKRPQIVTVIGQDDHDDDGDVVYGVEVTPISSENEYDDAQSVLVQVINKDSETFEMLPDGTPGVLVSPIGGLETSENGQKATFEVVLKGEPLSMVKIPVVSSNTKEGTVDKKELIFERTTWNQKQSVTITGVDDSLSDGDVAYTIQLGPVQSHDTRYANIPVSSVRVTNIDNDPPNIPASFKVSTTSLQIEESGKHEFFTIAPGTRPIAPVTVTMNVTDTSEGQITPTKVVFTEKDWETAQTVEVQGVVDGIEDGTQNFRIEFNVTSTDPRFNGYSIPPIQVSSADSDTHTGAAIKIRAMAANITSGNYQSYSEGHGIRIFQAVKPDIVLIQEFNMYNANDTTADIQQLVDTAFGKEFYYYHGNGSIPNGIISRYPILDAGYWTSNIVNNRNWDWAVIDLPGPKELLAVSVHLHTSKNGQEMPVLMEKIEEKIKQDKALGQSYFLLIGGDFNTKSRNAVVNNMSDLFVTSGPYPEDQEGVSGTSEKRDHPYDWLLCSPDWCANEIPVEIGAHTGNKAYTHGHVFDSRVYADTKIGGTTELEYVPPVQAGDSDAFQMQHMAVIRDFQYSY